MRRVAAVLGHARLQPVGEALGIGGGRVGGEHHFRRAGRQFLPRVAGAGGDDHRVPLRRPGDVQRAVQLEMAAVVADGVLRRRVEIQPGPAVQPERAVVPRVPEVAHDVHELAGPLVALGMGGELGVAEIARGVVVGRGHDVPCRPALAEVVERGELAGHVVRLGEAGGDGAAEADPLRHPGQRGQQGDGLQHVHEQREAGPGVEIFGACGRGVGDEEQVEQPALGGTGCVAVGGDVGGLGAPRVRVQPTGRVRSRRAIQQGQRHGAGTGHRRRLLRWGGDSRSRMVDHRGAVRRHRTGLRSFA